MIPSYKGRDAKNEELKGNQWIGKGEGKRNGMDGDWSSQRRTLTGGGGGEEKKKTQSGRREIFKEGLGKACEW